MKRLLALVVVGLRISNIAFAQERNPMEFTTTPLNADAEPMAAGPFAPTWESLSKQQIPDWFRDAKFGIWAHWGPQCMPERGDWYGRHMYIEGHEDNVSHVERFGHPSEYGFKEVIRDWKVEPWKPEALIAFYKQSGAKYFFAMANHHDNFDLWNSKHQPWNSVNLGPKRDIIAEWEKAARANGLPFGVSVHAAHAWSWYETSQGADKKGPKAGVPYDGKLTKADGAGKWWDGYDPQDLYAQSHPISREDPLGKNWDWPADGRISIPDAKFAQSIYDRTVDLINQHHPDLIYFDDTVLPLYPISDVGMKLAAHFYNANLTTTGGKSNGVLFGKVLKDGQKRAITWDVERGAPADLQPIPWQTCTCIGGWHYDRPLYERHGYKSAATVVHMMADIVSKNGNLLLNVPVRGDGTIDEDEVKIVEVIGRWMNANGEAIYGTRPWKKFGEGPASEDAAPIKDQGFNEGKGKPFTADDIRFTTKGDTIYAITLGVPTGEVKIKSLGIDAKLLDGDIKSVELVGGGAVTWKREADALTVELPADAKVALSAAIKIVTATRP
jgi:alpha-L-fucosidase